jgi:hypothetical protein
MENALRRVMDLAALSKATQRFHLVSYPRSGSTLLRKYLALLQGRPQFSVYNEDIVSGGPPVLSEALDHAFVVKSHQLPAADAPMIYLVRDGRNATLSFLYMGFLFGGHRYASRADLGEAIRRLDRSEGSWADHVARALRWGNDSQRLFLRYEDLVRDPGEAIKSVARFLGGSIDPAAIERCIRQEKTSRYYVDTRGSGYAFRPPPDTIFDAIHRKRKGDYWREIFDAEASRYFHETGGTEFLRHFGYEQSADWWKGFQTVQPAAAR